MRTSETVIIEETYYEGPPPAPSDIPRPRERARAFRSIGRFCIFAIALLVPVFYLPLTVDPVGINKIMVIGFLAAAAFVCFLGAVFEERTLSYPRSWFFPTLGLFILAEIVSAWTSVAPAQSFYGSLDQPDSVLALIICAVICYLTYYFLRPRDMKTVGLCAGVGLLVASIIGLVQLFGAGSSVLQNPIGSIAAWGILLVAVLAALGVAGTKPFSRFERWSFVVIACAAALGLLLINYQLLWLAVALFTIILAALRSASDTSQGFRYAFIIVVVALFLSLVGPRLPWLHQAPPDVRPSIGATFDAVGPSLLGWRSLVGTGPSTFYLDFALWKPVSVNETSLWNTTPMQGYDFVLTLLATGGLVAWLLFLGLLSLVGWWLLDIQSFSPDRAMLLSAAAFLGLALFLYPLFFAEGILFFLFIGAFLVDAPEENISFDGAPRSFSFFILIILMIIAAGTLATMYAGGERYGAAIFFGRVSDEEASGNLSQAFADMNQALALDRTDVYLRGASQLLIQEAQQLIAENAATGTAELPSVLANAVQAAQGATQLNGRDAANWGNLGSVYESIMPLVGGADTLAENSYGQAAALDPQNPQWDLAMGRVFVESAGLAPGSAGSLSNASQTADWSQAEALFEKALSLKDDYTDARIALINLYIKEGNTAQAISRVQELEQQNPLDPGVAFELGYLDYQSNQIAQAEQEFQVAAILEPDYANAHYYLGVVDAAQGLDAQALQQFDLALQLNPGNQQIETAIANLQAGEPIPSNATSSAPASQNELSVPKGKSK